MVLGAVVLVILYSLFDGGIGSLGGDLWSGSSGSSGGGKAASAAAASVRGGGRAGAAGGAACSEPAAAAPTGHVNRPVSVEWFGRSTEVIRYSPKLDDFPDGIFTTVYKHDFPGSTLW